jgi:hypothetical protein
MQQLLQQEHPTPLLAASNTVYEVCAAAFETKLVMQ